MKRICLILPSLNVGGMERVMIRLAKHFVEQKGDEVHLMIMVRHQHFYEPPKSVVIHQPDFNFSNKYRFWHTLRTLWFVRRAARKIKPDCVLSFGEMYNSFALLALFGLKIKVFVSDRARPDRPWGLFHEQLRKYLYPGAAGIVAQTEYAKRYLLSILKHGNITVIPNPVSKEVSDSEKRENIILYVGRLINTKCIDILLRVFSELNNVEWKLWIVGDGVRKQELKNLSAELKLTDHVIFWDKQKDVDKFYSKAKVFAFPSISEGFPNVLLEAMAAGLPCVSFDCVAGPAEIIQHGSNGFLVPERDSASFGRYIAELMRNDDLRINFSKRARERVRDFNIQKIGDMYHKFITS